MAGGKLSIDENKLFLGLILAIALTGAGYFVWAFVIPLRYVGYAPKQPIAFSHKLHAGKLKMECAYCHSQVERAEHSNVPATEVCMGCHSVVKADSPEIQKIHASWNEKKPIQWVNVHVMPDFVYFNHERHIAKGVQCSQCHGNVEEMEVVRQTKSLTMRFCVNCHRKPENNAPIDCSTCHR